MKTITKALALLLVSLSLTACSAFTEISSSTSTTSDAVTPDITLNEFVNKRYVAIRHDAANGGGENLDALAQLLGEKDTYTFAQHMKNNFDTIFSNVSQPSDIIARIEAKEILHNG